jgi:hypothetical protein
MILALVQFVWKRIRFGDIKVTTNFSQRKMALDLAGVIYRSG